ncbi:hypothetical protein ACE3MZ_09695 [Paenibacillus sp. WLX1005]|uniref:hypothetical protein n=1 Tax=Paenibacillus sp. WLX1005 TaxID=3243766 RepID=UPI0039843A0A
MREKKWSRTRFKQEFKRGLGSSFMELQRTSNREQYKDIVLWACLHNTCYDMQSEGGRSEFLYQAIKLYEDSAYFESEIIHTFMKSPKDSSAFDQICELVYSFAADGSIQAKKAMYEKYDSLLETCSRYSASFQEDNLEVLCICLTSLDGFTAFEKIVAELGEKIHTKQASLQFSWFYCNAESKFGKQRVVTYLEKHAEQQDNIKAFFDVVTSSYFIARSTDSTVSVTLQDVLNAARIGFARGISLRFAKIASDADLITLANVAVQETDPRIQLELLWTFRKVPFPLHPDWIFQLAEHKQVDLREIAFTMMQHLPIEQVRDYALNVLHQQKEAANVLELLCSCYRPGDEPMLYKGIKSLSISYATGEWHSVFMSAKKLLNNRSNQMTSQLFMYMYRTTLCSHCRYDLVRKMYDQNMLTDHILQQCLYDSHEDTRAFARRKLQNI